MIYIVTHKPEKLPRLAGYRGIQVGDAPSVFPDCIRDNTGDNISGKNANYCELTALYWIWKNSDDAFKGLAHYRRYFGRRAFSSSAKDILSFDELRSMLKERDIVAAKPAYYHVNAREQLLMDCCDRPVFDRLEQITDGLHPEYMPAFRAFFSGNRASQYNMMFCRRELFDAYCGWLFPVLFSLEREVDLSGADDYRKRLYGFLSERLMNVWMAHNRLRVAYAPVVSTAYTLKDHLTYFRRDVTNDLRFRLSRGRGG